MKKGISINVKDATTNETTTYPSTIKAVIAVGITAKTLVRYMKLKIPHNQYSFSNNGPVSE